MEPFMPQDVERAFASRGHTINIHFFDTTTANSQQAADNIGCELGQIAKSVAFMADGNPVLVLASGDQRVDDRKLAALLGISRKRVRSARAEECVEIFGYAPGGIPPLGHRTADLPIYIEDSLLRYDTVYAAGGEHNAIFPIATQDLIAATQGQVQDLKRDEIVQ